ncbi:MAG: T9SS type A sorting domain-containing protein [Flavobacteriales bacterium]|nr:T9SS type A sorting domain-containing protein [Flavobacteriales bacterium]
MWYRKRALWSILIIVLLGMVPVRAQSPNWLWARSVGGSAQSGHPKKLAVDQVGNVIVTGFFRGTFDLDPGVGVASFTSAGESDIFIQKLDAAGDLVWARRIGGIGLDEPRGLAVDADGSVLVVGDFQNTVDMDPGAGVLNFMASGYRDGFVVRISATGDLEWADVFTGPGSEQVASVVVGPGTDLTLGGSFEGPTDVDPGAGVTLLTAPTGTFLCRLDAAGAYLGSSAFNGTSVVSCYDIAMASDSSVVMVGAFSGTVDLDPGTASLPFASDPLLSYAYAVCVDASGAFMWARSYPATGNVEFSGVNVASDGSVVASGTFRDTVDFDPGAGVDLHVSEGQEDGFVTGLSAGGDLTWVRSFGDIAVESCLDQVLDADDNVWITGYFTNTVDFDAGPDTFLLDASGPTDAFVTRFDPSGTWMQAFKLGGNDDEVGWAIDLDVLDQVHVAGHFDSNTMTVGAFPLASIGSGSDVFIAKAGTIAMALEPEVRDEPGAVYPNPVRNGSMLSVAVAEGAQRVELIDATGRIRLMRAVPAGTSEFLLELADLRPGLYVVRVHGAKGVSCRPLVVD